MIKISALNKESEEESGSEEEVTKEALEQIALQQYSKALDLQKKGNLTDATQLLKDLLDTELLDEVQKPAPGEKISGPLFNLKYLCYKNLASMLGAAGKIEAAIEAYGAAADLDDTDVTLWHRLGLLCMQASRYEMALHAFQRGLERNPKHWPCLDKIVTLLLGLDNKEECIFTIYDALQLDPGYMRGLVYRKHIYTNYKHVQDYLEYLNPIYKWNERDEEPMDEEIAKKLLDEARLIEEKFVEQQKAEQFKYTLPKLKLVKPITRFTWAAVGESLTYMHKYMEENYFSHACHIELFVEIGEKEQTMEISEDVQEPEIEIKPEDTLAMDADKTVENIPENEISENDKEKPATDTEKATSDVEVVANDSITEANPETKKKNPVRRRGSDLSFLQQWEWCNKRRSGRKKPVNRQENDNIYDMLRRLVPIFLNSEAMQKDEEEGRQEDEIQKLNKNDEMLTKETDENNQYFGSDNEQNDVKNFISKYSVKNHDIIEMLQDYVHILSGKWKLKWPEDLPDIFVNVNKCFNSHIDPPACNDDNSSREILHYVVSNLLAEEFMVNKKMNSSEEVKHRYDLRVVDYIGLVLNLKPKAFAQADSVYSVNQMELVLRHLWVKLHIYLLNKCEELTLECLYQLTYEFEAMGDFQTVYSLSVVNFTFKPTISYHEITEYISFLERNKKLSTVLDLYDRGEYKDLLSIVIDSFEHCKDIARTQEEEMSLDFAVQLSVILDTYWALEDIENCISWSIICLHEALKHFFRYTSGSPDYEKWSLTVVKILSCIEHLINTKGLSVLEGLSRKQLSQGLEDIIRIIGHQVETNATEMPFKTVIPWIVMHFILQREDDLGRGKTNETESANPDDMPNPLLLLFIAHEQLGHRGWCCLNEGKLLYFILDTVAPRLRSPALSKCLEQVCQYMEQCVYCLYGHPGRKHKLKYLTDHNVSPFPLDWERAQQIYEIFRPPALPPLEGKISAITSDTEQLFHRILALLPQEQDPQKYIADVEKYIRGVENKLPHYPHLLPFKMRDIYFLLGDYYFKKEEGKMAIKYNILDVIVNNDRFEAWAIISLAKAVNLQRILNSCKNLNNEKEILNPAKAIIRCFKRSLELDPSHCNMWIEYGMFVYTIHSFCSRMLKQASESLSMEEFESLEKRKEDMLDTTHKCFQTALSDLNCSTDADKSEDSWLYYYMLGKVAEKQNRPPSEYLNYFLEGVKSLQETDATYPLKINYSSPANLSIEVLELHYRIHASILKYIEQHENKPIPASVGKTFASCIEDWKNGPFAKKNKKEGLNESATENDPKNAQTESRVICPANILKRSISDAGEGDTQEMKRLKTEAAAAKIRRSASYETERGSKDEADLAQPMEVVDTKKDENEIIAETQKPVNNIQCNAMMATPENIEGFPKETLQNENREAKHCTEKNDTTAEDKTAQDKKGSSSSSSSSSSSGSSSSESSSDSSSDSSRDSNVSTASSHDKNLTDAEIMNIVYSCLDALEDCASRFPPHYKAIYRLTHYHFYYKKGKDIERCRDLMLSTFVGRAGQKLGGLFSERKHSNFFNNIWKIPLEEVDRGGSFAFHMNRCVLLTLEILKEIDDHKTLLDLSLHLQRIPEPDKKYLRDSEREELAQQAFSLCVQSLKGQLLKFSQQADLKSNEVEKQALRSLMLDIYRAYQRVQKQPHSKQFTNLLVDAYKLVCSMPITDNMNLVDLSMKYCQSLIQALKQQATQASIDKSQNIQKKQSAKVIPETSKPTSTVNQPKVDTKSTTSTSASGLPKMSSQDMAAAFQNFMPAINDSVLQNQTAAALAYLNNISALAGYAAPLQNTLQSTLQSNLQNSFQAEFYRQFLTQSLSSYLPPQKPKQKRGPKPGVPRSLSAGNSQSKPSRPLITAPLTNAKSFTSVSTSKTKAHSAAPPAMVKSFGSTSTSTAKSYNSPSIAKPTTTVSTSSTKIYNALSSSTSKSTSLPIPIIGQIIKPAPLTPSMGTVLQTLPPSMAANLTSFGAPASIAHSSSYNLTNPTHFATTSSASSLHSKPTTAHTSSSSAKTLQEKLAERQKNIPPMSSLSKLPSSLIITKTSVSKPPLIQNKKNAKKPDNPPRPKPISSDEVIVLDDD